MAKKVIKEQIKTMKICCNIVYSVVKQQHSMITKGGKRTSEKFICMYRNKQKNNETEDGVTEKIQYYKTKDELYGIEVVKENNLPNKEIKDITEITEDEEEINNILDKLVSNMVMCNFEDIVNDLVKTRLCAY